MTQDFTFHIDATWVIDCTVVDMAKQPITIRSAEWRMANPTTRLVKATTDDGGVEITGLGACTVTIGLDRQTGIPIGTYDHELWIVDDANGNGSVAFNGQVHLVNSLKRRFP